MGLAPGGTPVTYPLTDSVQVSYGASWAWGSYAQLHSSLPNGFVLCGVAYATATSAELWAVIEVATGAAASEVPLDRFSFGMFLNDPTADATCVLAEAQLVTPYYIPAGTRLAARGASSAGSGSNGRMYTYGFTVPSPEIGAKIVDHMQFVQGHATKGGDRLPNTSFTTLAHSGAGWTAGAWVEISASVPEDCFVLGTAAYSTVSSRDWHIEFGVGAAGSEVVLPARLPVPRANAVTRGPQPHIPCPYPLYVPKGARLAARQYAAGTTGAVQIAAKVAYLK